MVAGCRERLEQSPCKELFDDCTKYVPTFGTPEVIWPFSLWSLCWREFSFVKQNPDELLCAFTLSHQWTLNYIWVQIGAVCASVTVDAEAAGTSDCSIIRRHTQTCKQKHSAGKWKREVGKESIRTAGMKTTVTSVFPTHKHSQTQTHRPAGVSASCSRSSQTDMGLLPQMDISLGCQLNHTL